jgi:hypothetical protein
MSQLQSSLGGAPGAREPRSGDAGAGSGAPALLGGPQGDDTSCARSRGTAPRRGGSRRPPRGRDPRNAARGAARARRSVLRRGAHEGMADAATGHAGAAAAGSRWPAAARAPRRSGRCRGGARCRSPSPSRWLGVQRRPSKAASFFCTSTRASARSARFCQRAASSSSSAIFLSRGEAICGTGPRFLANPANSPRSRAARQVARWDEYRPSRRSRAPTAPGVLHPSASRTIFRLYSRVNRRLVAFDTTSISGPPRARSAVLIGLRSLLALDSKLPGGHCLAHVGREGAGQIPLR